MERESRVCSGHHGTRPGLQLSSLEAPSSSGKRGRQPLLPGVNPYRALSMMSGIHTPSAPSKFIIFIMMIRDAEAQRSQGS